MWVKRGVLRQLNIEIQRIAQILVAVFDVRVQVTGQLHGADPGAVHFRQYAAIESRIVSDIVGAAEITPDRHRDPRFPFDHLLGNVVNGHGFNANWPVRTDQIAHGIGDLPVNQIDRGHFDYAAFQPAGFSVYYA
ncbi:hypothetical protein D3C71_1570100 [compost metagenome]